MSIKQTPNRGQSVGFRSSLIRCLFAASTTVISMTNASAGTPEAPNVTSPSLRETFTLSGYIDGGFHQTQFFEDHHDVATMTWDTRAEYWVSQNREDIAWGPYLRFAGIVSSKNPAWENNLQGVPGVGMQFYPFSATTNGGDKDGIGSLLGPVRLFGEYNVQDYWGASNTWRPDHQWRFGIEYWKAKNSNDLSKSWWMDSWHGLSWRSADENNNSGLVLGDAIRAGVRVPSTDNSFLSSFSPYAIVESSLSNRASDYWNNRLSLGGGVRFAPGLKKNSNSDIEGFFKYANLYAEYVYAVAYYQRSAPANVPDHEFRVGISIGFGEWFR